MLHVHMLPDLVPHGELAHATVVVIDVLRATTTISAALANGAHEIFPCPDLEKARQLAAGMEPRPLLGGERGGLKIDGFDLGNSPAEYGPEVVAGRQIVFTTTNGTRAMSASLDADRVLLGAFVNYSAMLEMLEHDENPVHLLCAGTNGEITQEDLLLAGALVEGLSDQGRIPANDGALTALQAWRALPEENLVHALQESHGGKNLQELDFHEDIELAAERDRWPAVGLLDPQTMTIRPSDSEQAIVDAENSG